MGSFCDLRIGGYSVVSQKYHIDAELLSFFVEADKVHAQHSPDSSGDEEGDADQDFHGYCSSATAIAERLDLMGFTPTSARADFELMLRREIEEKVQLAEAWSDRQADDEIYLRLRAAKEGEVAFLSTFSFDAWVESVRRIKNECVRWTGYDRASQKRIYSSKPDPIEAHVLNERCDDEHPDLGYYCSDIRFLIRAFLMVAAPTDLVVLDCTDMVNAGYFDAADPIAENARTSTRAGARAVEGILVLTEGCSDTRILRETLNALYPHLKEFLSFLDHDQFSVAGGAGNLLNLLRGLAGAGVSNRVLALFDNDTAGSVQFLKAKAMVLPRNFRVMQLPHIPLAEAYPTLGPTGMIETDINGLACSIELYLGKSALTEQSSGLVPVQWTGYERSLSRYQGELVDKRSVQERYLEMLRSGRADTTDMKLIFRHLLRAFHD